MSDRINPITQALSVAVCRNASDAILQGFDWRNHNPPVKPIEVKQVVVVQEGTQSGKATVDFVLQDEHGQRYVFMITAQLLKNLPI